MLTTTLALAAASVVAAAAGMACLADLRDLPPERDDAGPPPPSPEGAVFSGCGDSIIETLDDGGITGETCDPGDAAQASPGCEQCRFTCSGKIDDAGHCYFFADPTSSYSEAITACQAAGGHVVTFASKRELDFVDDLVASARDGGAYWVGLSINPELESQYTPHRGVIEPGYPASAAQTCVGCFGASDGGAFPTYPDAAAGSFLVASGGSWFQLAASTAPLVTVCEREAVGQRLFFCGGPNCTTLTATAGKKRYVLPQAFVTEDQAALACAPYGRLVLLDSNEEREQLVRELTTQFPLQPSKPVEVWIGLSVVDGGWAWDDGLESRPLPWGAGQPSTTIGRAFLRITNNEFDTQLARSGDAGTTPRAVVCERPPPK